MFDSCPVSLYSDAGLVSHPWLEGVIYISHQSKNTLLIPSEALTLLNLSDNMENTDPLFIVICHLEFQLGILLKGP